MFFLNNNFLFVKKQGPGFSKWWTQVFKMVDRGFHFGGPRFSLKILVDRGLVDRGSEKLSTTLTQACMRLPGVVFGSAGGSVFLNRFYR